MTGIKTGPLSFPENRGRQLRKRTPGIPPEIGAVFFIQRKQGGTMLILLSIALLLFGGGIFPPLIGIVGGVAGIKINKPQNGKEVKSFAARLWPWPLVIFMVWIWGQWIVGYFFNEILQQNMVYGLILILVTLPLSVYTAYAQDLSTQKI